MTDPIISTPFGEGGFGEGVFGGDAHFAAAPASSQAAAREWLIEARDNATLTRLGVIDDYQAATLIPRFNPVGAWTLDVQVPRLAKFAAEFPESLAAAEAQQAE